MPMSPPPLPPGSEENRAPAYKAFLTLMTILTTATITLRFWSRSMGPRGMSGASVHRFWWDDWVALLSVVLIMIYFAIAFVLVELGFGRHIWMVKADNLPQIFKLLYSIYYIYDISLFTTKTSALFFLMRLFPKHANSRLWNHTLYATHGLNVAWLLGIVLGTFFMCSPVQKGWDPMLPGHCGTTSALWTGSAIPSVFIDLVILLLPIPKIWSLQMGRSQKVGITLVFILGYCVIIVSLGRMITVLKSAKALNEDITYEGMPMVYWVTSEAPTTLISICLPPMLNLIRRFYSNFLLPLSGKVSSLMSSRMSRDSNIKSQSGTFELSHERANDRKDMHLRLPSTGSAHSLPDTTRSLRSMDSRNGLVTKATTPDVLRYTKSAEISNTQPLREQYMAYIESGGAEQFGVRNDMPSRQIQVGQQITVDRQARRI